MVDPNQETTRELFGAKTWQPAMLIMEHIRATVYGDRSSVLRIISGVIVDDRGSSLMVGVPTVVMQLVAQQPKLTEMPPLATEILEAPAAVREIVFANLVAIVANSLRERP